MLKQPGNPNLSHALSIWSRDEQCPLTEYVSKKELTLDEIKTDEEIKKCIKICNQFINFKFVNKYYHFKFTANFSIFSAFQLVDFLPHPYLYFKENKIDFYVSKVTSEFDRNYKLQREIEMIYFDVDNVTDQSKSFFKQSGPVKSIRAHIHNGAYSPRKNFQFRIDPTKLKDKPKIRFLVFMRVSTSENFDCFLIEIQNSEQSFDQELLKALKLSEDDVKEINTAKDEGLWNCESCTLHNTSGKKCEACGTPKPNSSISSSSQKLLKECPNCTYINSISNANCEMCESKISGTFGGSKKKSKKKSHKKSGGKLDKKKSRKKSQKKK